MPFSTIRKSIRRTAQRSIRSIRRRGKGPAEVKQMPRGAANSELPGAFTKATAEPSGHRVVFTCPIDYNATVHCPIDATTASRMDAAAEAGAALPKEVRGLVRRTLDRRLPDSTGAGCPQPQEARIDITPDAMVLEMRSGSKAFTPLANIVEVRAQASAVRTVPASSTLQVTARSPCEALGGGSATFGVLCHQITCYTSDVQRIIPMLRSHGPLRVVGGWANSSTRTSTTGGSGSGSAGRPSTASCSTDDESNREAGAVQRLTRRRLSLQKQGQQQEQEQRRDSAGSALAGEAHGNVTLRRVQALMKRWNCSESEARELIANFEGMQTPESSRPASPLPVFDLDVGRASPAGANFIKRWSAVEDVSAA